MCSAQFSQLSLHCTEEAETVDQLATVCRHGKLSKTNAKHALLAT